MLFLYWRLSIPYISDELKIDPMHIVKEGLISSHPGNIFLINFPLRSSSLSGYLTNETHHPTGRVNDKIRI